MIRVVIADDEALIRAGIRGVLETADDITVAAEAGNGKDAIALVRRHHPDVLLVDVRMPEPDGLAVTEIVGAHCPGTAVVVLTTFALDEYVHRAVRAGAAGFLLKDCDPRDLINAVRTVAAGNAILSPRVTRSLLDHFAASAPSRGKRARDRLSLLTGKELDVVRRLAQGLSNAEIAQALQMSEGAVKAHISRTFIKLGADNRVQVALLAYDAGLVSG